MAVCEELLFEEGAGGAETMKEDEGGGVIP